MNRFGVIIPPMSDTIEEILEHINTTAPDFVVMDLNFSFNNISLEEKRRKLVQSTRSHGIDVYGIYALGSYTPGSQAEALYKRAGKLQIDNVFLRIVEWPIRNRKIYVKTFLAMLPKNIRLFVCTPWNYLWEDNTLAHIMHEELYKGLDRRFEITPMLSANNFETFCAESVTKGLRLSIETVIFMDVFGFTDEKILATMPESVKNVLFWAWSPLLTRETLSKYFQPEENMPRKSQKTLLTPKERPIIAKGLVLQGPLAKRDTPSASARVKGTLQVGDEFNIVEIVNGNYAMTTTGLYILLWSGKVTYVIVTPIS